MGLYPGAPVKSERRPARAKDVGFRVFIEIKIFMDSHSASKRVACLRHILEPL